MDQTVDVTPDAINFALLLTAVGTGIAAGIVSGLVALIKATFVGAAQFSGAAMAFVASLALYVLAAIATDSWRSLDLLLVVFVSWLTCASAAVGLNQVVARGALTKTP